jgi:hypothetical protein
MTPPRGLFQFKTVNSFRLFASGYGFTMTNLLSETCAVTRARNDDGVTFSIRRDGELDEITRAFACGSLDKK